MVARPAGKDGLSKHALAPAAQHLSVGHRAHANHSAPVEDFSRPARSGREAAR
jgi:hypothetical protein